MSLAECHELFNAGLCLAGSRVPPSEGEQAAPGLFGNLTEPPRSFPALLPDLLRPYAHLQQDPARHIDALHFH